MDSSSSVCVVCETEEKEIPVLSKLELQLLSKLELLQRAVDDGQRALDEIIYNICNHCHSGECRYCNLYKLRKSLDYVGLQKMTPREAVKETIKEEETAIRHANEKWDRENGRYAVHLRRFQ